MEPKLTWLIFSCLISQVHLDLSVQEISLLDTDKNPKCFTRDLESFTCFWESTVGKSFYFIYKFEGSEEEIRCDVKQQLLKNDEVLNVCDFPPSDVYLLIETQIRVVDIDTNSTVYNRNVSVEIQLLLYPPSNITLCPTGEVGQMLVDWKPPKQFWGKAQYEIRYHSKTKQNSKELVSGSSHKLTSLVPGENCTMQMRVRPVKGFWSDWSSNVTAMVPQSSDDIKLWCRTADLNQLLCKWSTEIYEGRYNLHYRQTNRSSWSSWKVCSEEHNTVSQCVLHGEESTVYQIYLSAGLEQFGRTFYRKTFSMNSTIQTEPPRRLWAEIEGSRLCLNWDPPLMMISEYLMYQIQYKLQGDNRWKIFTVPSSKISTCLDVQQGSEYTIQVKARPDGSIYSGYWSDWTEPLTVHLPSGKEWIFIVCVPLALLIIAFGIISLFYRYFSKVKQTLWPSVPNLNKVLESILTDFNGSHWEPSFNIKQCEDDTYISVVEILSEADVARKPCKVSTCLSVPEQAFLVDEKENFVEDLEIVQDYVLLKNNDTIPCFRGNNYTVRDIAFSHLTVEKLNCSPSQETTTNILNHSYLLSEQPELQEEHSARRYTNLEITARSIITNGE
ncbi:thrombopoietin receptor [Triplophysa dalaica]|uniref:thrombopoietin receptor n=1 Tax=Triplophysa dalaica TaxID=1582913 RepID=UPI0024E03551|nr:thrombopoietin receptor [Triplophysa dalaica]